MAAGTSRPSFFQELPADGVYCLDVRRMLRELDEGLDEVCEMEQLQVIMAVWFGY